MAYWLMKSEPETFGWDHLVRDGKTEWDGVRNWTASRHLREMQVGDQAFFYHSGKEKGAVGIMEVTRAAKPDGEGGWVSVEMKPVAPLPGMVTLAAMRAEPRLGDFVILRQSRLSVAPVSEGEWAAILDMAR